MTRKSKSNLGILQSLNRLIEHVKPEQKPSSQLPTNQGYPSVRSQFVAGSCQSPYKNKTGCNSAWRSQMCKPIISEIDAKVLEGQRKRLHS